MSRIKVMTLNLGGYSFTGGIERYSRNLHNALLETGYPTLTLSLWDRQKDVEKGAGGPDGISYIACARNKILFLIKLFLQLIRFKPELICATHILFLPLIYFIRFFRPATKLLVVCHGIEVWKKLPIIYRFPIRRLDRIVTVSRFTADKLIESNKVPRGIISTCYHSLDPDLEESSEKDQKQAVEFPEGRLLLTVSRLNDQPGDNVTDKGITALVSCLPPLLKKHPDVHYLIVGEGPASDSVKKLAEQLGVDGHVHLLGRLSDVDLKRCYQKSDIFAMPSVQEGFGIVFLEAMHYKLPVIAGNQDASPEVVLHNQTGIIVNPGNTEEIVSALSSLLQQPQLRMKLGEAAKQRVLENFTFDIFKSNIENIINSIIPAAVQ